MTTKTIHRTDKNKYMIDFELQNNSRTADYTKPALIKMKDKVFYYLSDEEKNLMNLKYVECLSDKKIGKILNIRQQSVNEKINKLSKDIEQIIVKYILLFNNKEELNDKEYKIYEYYYLYRFSIKKIAEITKISRNSISKIISEIETKIEK